MPKQVSINDANLKRKINTILNRIENTGKATTEDIAKLGMNYIQFNMPVNTGDSARSITWATSVNTRGYHEAKIKQEGTPHPDASWDGEWFNIPWFMFDSDKAINHFRHNPSGNIQAMRDVIPMLREQFYRRVTLEINKDTKR